MISKRLRKLSKYVAFVFPAALVVMYVWATLHMSTATAATQASVGVVETVVGKGWSVSSAGAKFAKAQGDVVAMNEVVATGYKSGMLMSFVDGTTMKLGADAQITIDEMVYDPDDGQNDSVVMTLKTGAFYFVSGKVAKQKVTLITPTATIGIRGTELLISVDANGSTTVGVAKGRAFMSSRENSSRTEIGLGDTARSDDQGNVSESHKGLDLTGDDDIDRNVEGVSDWLGDDDDKKSDDISDFASDDHEDDGKEDDDKKDDDKEGDGEDRGDNEDSGDQGDNDGEDQKDGEDGDSEGQSDGDGGDGDGGDGDGDGGDSDSDGGDSDGGDSDGGDSDGGDSDGGDSDGGDSDGGDSDGGDSDSDGKSHD